MITKINEFRNQNLAPNGRKSRLTSTLYNLVRSDDFKQWFGDWENEPNNASVVLDDNGEPLLLYHGSSGSFSKFSNKYRGTSTNAKSAKYGVFFTDDKNDAIAYSKRYAGGKLISAFLNLRYPIIEDFNGQNVNADKELLRLLKMGGDGVIALNLKDGFVVNNQYVVKDEDDIYIISIL